jgi:hypothetical protein
VPRESIDHLTALDRIDGHGGFAENVLASLGSPLGQLAVHPGRHCQINDVDRFVGDDTIEGVVVLDMAPIDAPCLRISLSFTRIA